jgi:hypothetical protein
MFVWHRVRRILGLHDVLLVVAFLAANTVVEVALSIAGTPVRQLAWLGVLVAATVLLALRAARRPRRSTVLTSASFGVAGDDRLSRRRGAVVIVGLDSDAPASPMALLLAAAEDLEFVAFVGTHETRSSGVIDRIRSRLFAALGVSVPAENVRVWEHNHAMSVGDFAEATSEALEWLRRCGVDPADMVVDISAGRRMAGFGALQAADAVGVETQYLAYAWDHTAHRPITSTHAFRVVSSYSDDAVAERDSELAAVRPLHATSQQT